MIQELQWVDKYKPKTIDDMVLDDSTREMFKGYIAKNTCPNIILMGIQGIGKTTLMRIICNSLNANTIEFNASMDNGVDTVRNRISNFTSSYSIDGSIKIVGLDEFDRMSPSAQAALRGLIEESSDDTRFIATGNDSHLIMDALKSRCTPINLSFSKTDMIKRMVYILKAENIKGCKENKQFIIDTVNTYFPDIRRCINVLEQASISGTLNPLTLTNNSKCSIIAKTILDNWQDVRKCRETWITESQSFSNDYTILAKSVYEQLTDVDEMIILGDSMARLRTVPDAEVEFNTFWLKLYKNRIVK